MKKYYLFIAVAMIAAMAVSCNNKNANTDEANAEVVEAAKTILADDVLATLDEIGKPFFDESGKFTIGDIISNNLTEEDKLIKPDYLLNPSEVNNLITKAQKVNALAIFAIDRKMMEAYGMPLDEVNEAIARLMTEIGAPSSFTDTSNKTLSEKIAEGYKQCKENGDLVLFWQFQFAIVNETAYIISQNPELFFNNLSEEQFAAYNIRFASCYKAVKEIAKYDEEVAAVLKIFEENRSVETREESLKAFGSLATAKQTFIDTKDVIAARRAAFLK